MADHDLLAQLKDIHVSAWPETWPWTPLQWIVCTMLILVLGFSVWCGRRAFQKWRQKWIALTLLKQIRAHYLESDHPNQMVQDMNMLLKRYVKQSMEREALVLFGEEWLIFLEKKAPGLSFREGPGAVLAVGGYRPQVTVDTEALYHLLRSWIWRSH